MFAKICGNVCKESFFACLLISPETWYGVYHFPDLRKMVGTKKAPDCRMPFLCECQSLNGGIFRSKSVRWKRSATIRT